MVTSLVSPTYSVKYYRDDFYKVIRFNTPRTPRLPGPRSDKGSGEGKLSQSLSRAKSVITQVSICNDWDYFFTCTLDRTKHDRYSIKAFQKKFPQWIQDYNKKHGIRVQYLVVPEKHKDGAWHLHGFIRGLPDRFLSEFVPFMHPHFLIENGYLNWNDMSEKFGYCSFAPIKDAVKAAFYITKYVTKDMAESSVGFGCHLYYCSVGLRRAVPMGYVYGRYAALDRFISNDSKYCSTGFASGVDWVFFSDYVSPSAIWDLDEEAGEERQVWTNVEPVQLNIAGWCSG